MKRGSIFETDGIPRIQEALPLALQHVVAMIVGCVTPAIIEAQQGLRIRIRSFLFRQLW